MSSSMLNQLIPNFPHERLTLDEIAAAGWVVGFNLGYRGAEYLHNGFPSAWQRLYADENYYFSDPVTVWIIANEGWARWSDVSLPDPKGVMAAARRHGLRYGVSISGWRGGKLSFMSLARSDRELSDVEIQMARAQFDQWRDLVLNRASLTQAELDVLRCFKGGMGQMETAQALDISESTVKQRAIKACGKLGARTRTQAVAIALLRNYL